MSDTPRTDSVYEHVNNLHNEFVCSPQTAAIDFVEADFARQLERELSATLADKELLRAQLNTALSDLGECQRELAEARQQIGSLIAVKDERDEWRLLAEQAADSDPDFAWTREYARVRKLYPAKP